MTNEKVAKIASDIEKAIGGNTYPDICKALARVIFSQALRCGAPHRFWWYFNAGIVTELNNLGYDESGSKWNEEHEPWFKIWGEKQ